MTAAERVHEPAVSSTRASRLAALPPLRAILALALPTSTVMVLGAISGVANTYLVARLGADAIAGVALVFPIHLILMTLIGGGIGAGISAAVAHALVAALPVRGCDRRVEADLLAAFVHDGRGDPLRWRALSAHRRPKLPVSRGLDGVLVHVPGARPGGVPIVARPPLARCSSSPPRRPSPQSAPRSPRSSR